jgi:gamma-glutamyltranspeptidase/glutathione hydrolase
LTGRIGAKVEGEGVNETVVGEKGMAVAPHRAAAEVAAEVMREGGNAVEAAIAAAATIAAVYPHMNSIGGDAFFLIAEPGKPVRAIDACGAAGSLATIERYRKKGYDTVPPRGPDAALTVAGAVSGWMLAGEAATALGGRIDRRDLLADAVRRAREGIVVSRSQSEMAAKNRDDLKDSPGFAGRFLVDGKAPEIGSRLNLEKLSDTLDRLAHAGFDDFYRGDVAAEVAADLEEVGSPVTREDLRKHEARLVKPLTLTLDDATVHNMTAPTQGLASLIILGLFDRLGVKRGEGFDHIHGLIEATKCAFAVRDSEITDPRYVDDLARFLAPDWLDEAAGAIDRKRASRWGKEEGEGDTIWMGAIDRNGLTVSFIQSLFWEYGSGVVLPRTGILWQNRGSSFSLDPKSLNPLTPGRKPFHTLNPPLARFNDGRTMTYGSMGGDGQPQFQSAIFTRHARFGMEPGEAIDAPRWRLGRTWGHETAELVVENRFDPDLVEALARAGHTIEVLDLAYADSMGHAGMIVRRADGRLFGASDPRSDGAAVAV